MQHARQGLYALAFILSATLGANAQQIAPGTIPNVPVNATPAPQNAQPARPATSGTMLPGGVIEPGDQLNVQVYGDQSLTQTVTVTPDGTSRIR